MRNFYAFLITLLIGALGFGQTSIYLEEFSRSNRGYNQNTDMVNLNGVDWTIDISRVSSATLLDDRFRFKTIKNGTMPLFQARRVRGGTDWISPIIDISNDTDVTFTIDLSQGDGSLEPDDIVTTTYSIDGGPFSPVTTNHTVAGTIAPGTIVSQAALNGATLQIKVTFISNNNNDRQQMDNVSVIGFPKTYTFANGSWSPTDPNGKATNENRGKILVTAGDTVISEDTNINTVVLNPGASLTIDSDTTLTVGNVTNGLTLESTSALYSSLINNGDISGTVNYERHVNKIGEVTEPGNDLIALPLIPSSGLTFDVFIGLGTPANASKLATNGFVYAFGPYNTTTPAYENFTVGATAALIKGKGYRAATTSEDTFLTFSGAVEPNNVSIVIGTPIGGSQWNLVGNPYPSYINSLAFLTANAAVLDDAAIAIYGYNSNTRDGAGETTGNFTIINNATNASLNIAPGQGFFIAANATPGFTGSLVFNNGTASTTDMRTLIGVDDFIVGRTPMNYNLKLDLIASNTSRTSFYFNENSSLGLDPGYDAAVYGANGNDFLIYSHLVENNTGRAMALQSLNTSELNNVTIPLGVNAHQGEQLRFTISDANLPSTVSVYLEDTTTNTSTLLTILDYVLTPTTDLSGTGRFFLRFADSALSDVDNTLDALRIYTNDSDKTIVITGQLLEATTANVYDLQGRLVAASQLETSKSRQSIDVSNLSTGVYVVQLTDASNSKSQKLIIR
jgi:hypothetical protein